MTTKIRPFVDDGVYALARTWIVENYVIDEGDADAVSDCLEDAVWDFADAIQREMEAWLNDAEGRGRLRLLRGTEGRS